MPADQLQAGEVNLSHMQLKCGNAGAYISLQEKDVLWVLGLLPTVWKTSDCVPST